MVENSADIRTTKVQFLPLGPSMGTKDGQMGLTVDQMFRLREFESLPMHQAPLAQVGRATSLHLEGSRFES